MLDELDAGRGIDVNTTVRRTAMTTSARIRFLALASATLTVGMLVTTPNSFAAPARHTVVAKQAVPAKAAGLSAPDDGDKLTGTLATGFLLCNYANWSYKPNSTSYYQSFWTTQDPAGEFKSLPDYFADESYGALTMAGSKVLGWYPMKVSETAWAAGNLETVKWMDCANAALAARADLSSYKSIVEVSPWVRAIVTGDGIPAWTSDADWPTSQAHPNPETFTVDSTSDWPPAPFYLNLPIGTYGQSSLVTKYTSHSVTVIRGEGPTQAARSTLTQVNSGATVSSNTNDDQAYVGPVAVYLNPNAQPCASGGGTCPEYSLNQANGGKLVHVGMAALGAGDIAKDDAYTNGIGDSAHEVGHTTGYNHSRALSNSQTDYGDCYDQMSYNCGLPNLPGEAGPPDDIENYDAINLEYHGWIPTSKQFNSSNSSTIGQSTITLHALSDPNALKDPGYLDAHLPAKVTIEDATPKGVTPTVPATCSGTGYLCESSAYYTVEYRQKYGFDSELTARFAGSNPAVGSIPSGAVLLHLAVANPNNCSSGCNISYLVDSQPGVSSGGGAPKYLPNDGALQPGMDYADPSHHVYVAVNSFDSSTKSAKVTVSTKPIKATVSVQTNAASVAGSSVNLQGQIQVGGAPVPDQNLHFSLSGGGVLHRRNELRRHCLLQGHARLDDGYHHGQCLLRWRPGLCLRLGQGHLPGVVERRGPLVG